MYESHLSTLKEKSHKMVNMISTQSEHKPPATAGPQMKVQQEQRADRSIPRLLQLTLHEGRERPHKKRRRNKPGKGLPGESTSEMGRLRISLTPSTTSTTITVNHYRRRRRSQQATADQRQPHTTQEETKADSKKQRDKNSTPREINLHAADAPPLKFRRRRV